MERMLKGRSSHRWDVYREDSLKAQIWQNHGAENHLWVTNNTSIPVNWKDFLHVDANKYRLFRLLASAIQEFQPPHGKHIISTHGQNAVSSPMSDLSDLYCTLEEADTRLPFHASHAFHHGFSKMMIRGMLVPVLRNWNWWVNPI